MRTLGRVLLAGMLALVGGRALAADQLVLGKVLLVKDPSPNPAKRLVKVIARELASSASVVGDPTLNGATLRVVAHGGTDQDQTFPMPAAGWVATSAGFRYRDFPGDYGPVKVAILKKTKGGAFLVRVVAVGYLGAVSVVPPNPGTDGGAVLTIPGGDRYCTNFGGPAGGQVVNFPPGNAFKKFKIAAPTGETPCLASPGGAFLDEAASVLD